jgi:flagellar hook assembly protein FlgD
VDACRIRYSLARAGNARITVYGLDGRLERKLVDEDRPAGPQEVAWDGVDGSGARVAPGEYFVVLETGGKTLTRRMVLLR